MKHNSLIGTAKTLVFKGPDTLQLPLNPRGLGSEEVPELFRGDVFAEAGLFEATEWDGAVNQIAAIDSE